MRLNKSIKRFYLNVDNNLIIFICLFLSNVKNVKGMLLRAFGFHSREATRASDAFNVILVPTAFCESINDFESDPTKNVFGGWSTALKNIVILLFLHTE